MCLELCKMLGYLKKNFETREQMQKGISGKVSSAVRIIVANVTIEHVE